MEIANLSSVLRGRVGWALLFWSTFYLLVAFALLTAVNDADIWWHLRTGQWVAEHGTVPMTDPFSSYGSGKSWVAYSWLFELLVYDLYANLGLRGVLLYRVVLSLAVVAAVHRLLARRLPPVLGGLARAALVGLATVALLPRFAERSYLVTILFTALTLDGVLALREGRRTRTVWLLPVAFAIWANVHIQFIYGLFVLGLGCAVPWIERLLGRSEPEGESAATAGSPGWRRLVLLTGLCLAATLVNPYHARLYGVVLDLARQAGIYDNVVEMQAPKFRDPGDWATLALFGLAACALGHARKLCLFETLLLAAAAFTSFRSMRDSWFVVLVASAVLATFPLVGVLVDRVPARSVRLAVGVVRAALIPAFVVVAIAVFYRVSRLSEDALQKAVAADYPVGAVDFIVEQGYRGRVYNTYDWGGYLLWRLPPELTVSMDNRSNVHGDDRIERRRRIFYGYIDWASDEEFEDVRVVVVRKKYPAQPLGLLLPNDHRSSFRIAYEDKVAIVLVRQPSPSSGPKEGDDPGRR
jgi:hypothetical protein